MRNPIHGSRVCSFGLCAAVLGAFVVVAGAAPSARAEDPSSPRADAKPATAAFKTRHEVVVGLVKSKAALSALEAELDKVIDYAWIARAALGGDKYTETCASRCAEFETLLRHVIRDNYVKIAMRSADHPLTFVDEDAGRNDLYRVTTSLSVQKHGRTQTVKLAFVLKAPEGDKGPKAAWRIQDIVTDDVSLAKTYRHEFAKQLRQGGIDAVIDGLKSKVRAREP